MNSFYWDASALAKRYAPELGTSLVNHLFTYVVLDRMMCLVISTGEVMSILVRRKNNNRINADDFSQALENFRAEVIDSAAFQLASIEDALVLASHPLIEQHSLNATDALVLRSALDAAAMVWPAGHDTVLIASDHRLLRAAQAEGLQTFNPELNTQTYLDALIQAGHGKETT